MFHRSHDSWLRPGGHPGAPAPCSAAGAERRPVGRQIMANLSEPYHTKIDRTLPPDSPFRGKAGSANAKLAYAGFRSILSGPRWEALTTRHAHLQRPRGHRSQAPPGTHGLTWPSRARGPGCQAPGVDNLLGREGPSGAQTQKARTCERAGPVRGIRPASRRGSSIRNPGGVLLSH